MRATETVLLPPTSLSPSRLSSTSSSSTMRFSLVFALASSLVGSLVLASPTSTQPEKRFAAASPGTCSYTCPTSGPGTFTNSYDYYPSGQADMTIC